MVSIGIYQHYKGGFYRVIGNAKDTETGEDMVVYNNLDGRQMWVRPERIWNSPVQPKNQVQTQSQTADQAQSQTEAQTAIEEAPKLRFRKVEGPG